MNATHKKVLLAAYALSLFVMAMNWFIEDWLTNSLLTNLLVRLAGLSIIGIIIAYALRFKAQDKAIYNHAVYLTRTFWIYLIIIVVLNFAVLVIFALAITLAFNQSDTAPYIAGTVLVSFPISTIWYVYRIVKGMIFLYRDKDIRQSKQPKEVA